LITIYSLLSRSHGSAKILAASLLLTLLLPSYRVEAERIIDPHLQNLELRILNADGTRLIGSTVLTVSSDDPNETRIKGQTKYLDGERDDEDARVELVDGSPRLGTYEHTFFNSDGRKIMEDTVDTKLRIATCARDESGSMKARTVGFDFPSDTFVGASQVLMVMAKLREGRRKIDFHAFACVPGPRLFYIHAGVADHVERWPYYRGDLVRLDLRPDLGIGLGLIIAPFLPKTEAWFDPNKNWAYVGGEFNRYFGGPHVLEVLVPLHQTQSGSRVE
jgi:hypothetical protein